MACPHAPTMQCPRQGWEQQIDEAHPPALRCQRHRPQGWVVLPHLCCAAAAGAGACRHQQLRHLLVALQHRRTQCTAAEGKWDKTMGR